MKHFLYIFTVFCLISCGQDKKAPDSMAAENEVEPGLEKNIAQFFEEVNVVKMHLFSAKEAQPNPEEYPYVGKEIPASESNLGLLAENLKNSDGKIYACYKLENSKHYILRVTGENGSDNLVLAIWDDKKQMLTKVNDLAHFRCSEGICYQQDAWLTDLDDDRDLELVTRQHQKDQNGSISNEKFSVASDDGSGIFSTAQEALVELAIKDRYVMR